MQKTGSAPERHDEGGVVTGGLTTRSHVSGFADLGTANPRNWPTG